MVGHEWAPMKLRLEVRLCMLCMCSGASYQLLQRLQLDQMTDPSCLLLLLVQMLTHVRCLTYVPFSIAVNQHVRLSLKQVIKVL